MFNQLKSYFEWFTTKSYDLLSLCFCVDDFKNFTYSDGLFWQYVNSFSYSLQFIIWLSDLKRHSLVSLKIGMQSGYIFILRSPIFTPYLRSKAEAT